MTPPLAPQTSPAQTLLARCGLDATPARLAVLAELLDAGRALSAPEIYAHMRERCASQNRPRPNRVTVYRTLDLLAEHGLALRTSAGDRTYRYCCRAQHTDATAEHAHFYCRSCGSMECLTGQNLQAALPAALHHTLPNGRQVEHLELRLDGLCSQCATRGE